MKVVVTGHNFESILLILNLEEKNLAGQEKKIYSDLTFHSIIIYLPFSQYNHIHNIEVYPGSPKGEGVYCFTSVRPSKIFFVTFFSATIDGRNLIFGHKLHSESK
jgi:hypothetical protein